MWITVLRQSTKLCVKFEVSCNVASFPLFPHLSKMSGVKKLQNLLFSVILCPHNPLKIQIVKWFTFHSKEGEIKIPLDRKKHLSYTDFSPFIITLDNE